MNAVWSWSRLLSSHAIRRLGGISAIETRFELNLAGFLNRLHKADLETIGLALKVPVDGNVGNLRARLWLEGAARETGSEDWLGSAVQPVPIVLGERLQFQAPPRGTMPGTDFWPRPIPTPRDPPGQVAEPDSCPQLLAAAERLRGVRLGKRGRDKGYFGARVAELLGVVEHGRSEPDWRGEIEIKTLPVVRDRSGLWRVKEDPAVAMENASPHKKLARVLWVIRVADAPNAPILSWYYQERDAYISALITRDLHTRPKGPKGTWQKGWYLRKRFFLDSGLLASING